MQWFSFFSVSDLVQKKGSKAGEVLREKANQLELALNETKAQYNIDMMPDWFFNFH